MRIEKLAIGKEFILSVAIHAFVLGGAVALIGHFGQVVSPPAVVFLSTELPGGNEGGGSVKAAPQERAAPVAQSRKKTVVKRKQAKKISVARNDDSETRVPDTKTVQEETPAPLASEVVTEGAEREGKGSGGIGGGGFGYGSGGLGGSGGGTGRGHGTGSGDRNILAEQYLARHFAYIRNLIMKHLKYPRIARKMGWKGKVTVAFIIKENGGVETSRILASSGYEVLDRQVLTVIREIQPFPKPPTRAELIVPVVYRLE